MPGPRGNIQNLIDSFSKLSDEEKQQYLDALGEMVGGTLGAVAGGGPTPLGMIGAGAGSVAGRGVARLTGKHVLGLEQKPTTLGEELVETGKTFALGAGGEGLGRVLPLAARPLKTARSLIRRGFTPDDARRVLVDLADRYDIPMNIAQRSGKPALEYFQAALERLPFATKTMQKSYQKQYGAWIESMNRLLDRVHAGQVSPEDFSRIAERSFQSLRNELTQRLSTTARSGLAAIHPDKVTVQEAGIALKEGLNANLDAFKKWADGAYGKIRREAGSVPIDVTALADEAGQVLDTLPDAPLSGIFPSKSKRLASVGAQAKPKPSEEFLKLRDAASQSLAGGPFDALPPDKQKSVIDLLGKMGMTGEDVPTTITLEQAMNLRSQLLDYSRRLTWKSNATEIRQIHSLVDGINESLEASLGGTPHLGELKAVNKIFREKAEALRPPISKGKRGNVAARIIMEEEIPERLPAKLAKSKTLMDQARRAASPETVSDITGEALESQWPKVERAIAESAVEASTVVDPATGLSRVSPARYASKSVKAETVPPLGGIGEPQQVIREQQLYKAPLAKAVEAGDVNRIMGRAFPPKSPETARRSTQLFGEAGAESEARRAFGENLLQQSRTQSRELGDIRFLNPRTLERKIEEFGGTVPEVLGQPAASELGQLGELGKVLTKQEILNPSGTARGLEALQAAKALANPLTLPFTLTSIVGTPYAGAKAFTNPRLARWLTEPAGKLMTGGPAMGAVGRGALTYQGLPPRVGEQRTGEEWVPAGFTPAGDQEEEWTPQGFVPAR